MWPSKIKSLLKRFVLVFVAILLAIGILPTNSALAVPYGELGAEGRAQSYAYYRAILECVDGSGDIAPDIAGDPARDGHDASPAKGDWFGDDDTAVSDVWAGFGKDTKCNVLLATALREYWGFEEGEDYKFLDENLGYDWINQNGTYTWVRNPHLNPNGAAFTTAIRKIDPSIVEVQPAYTYWLARQSFEQNCSTFERMGADSELSATQRNIVNGGDTVTKGTIAAYGPYEYSITYYRKIKTVGDNSISEAWYSAVNIPANYIGPLAFGGPGNNPVSQDTSLYTSQVTDNNNINGIALTFKHQIYINSDAYSCMGLIDQINNNAPAFLDALANDVCSAIVKQPDGTVIGPFFRSELSACKDGFKHPGSTTYCQQTWGESGARSGLPNDETQNLIAKCVTGQGAVSGYTPVDTLTGGIVAGSTSCAIPGLGWIVCPIMNFMAGVNDKIYTVIDGMLATNTESVSSNGDTYTAWQVMRNFANVGFVVFFLIIIFSQVTSIGISNYGIKKLLPRLVIAAILVNISFFVCQVAVDLSNILGGSIRSLLNVAVFDPGGNTGTLVGGVLAATATLTFGGAAIAGAIYGAAGLLLPVLLAALLAVIVTVGILAMRQVFVILLVVLSPLAFLAMLLPNTEKLFKQWRKMLVGMLILYPMIALLFGGSALAANIIVGNSTDVLNQIIGILITFVPLALTPMLVKSSLNAIPFVGGLASKLASKTNSNLGKSFKPFIDNQRGRREAGLDRWGRERKPARFGLGVRNRKDVMKDASGQPILDRQGNTIPVKSRRRSLTQVSGDARRDVEKEVTTNKTKAETGWQQRGLEANTRAARRTRGLVDEEKNEGLRKQAVETTYEARMKERTEQDPGLRSVNDQLQDAKQHVASSENRQKQRQIERVRDGALSTVAVQLGSAGPQALRDIQREEYVATAGTKTGEAQVKEANDESGVANDYIQAEKAATFGSKVVEAEQDKEFDIRKNEEADLKTLAEREDLANRTSVTAEAETKERLEGIADTDDALRKLREREEAAKEGTAAIEARQKAELQRRKAPGGNLYGLTEQQQRSKLDAENAENAQKTTFESSKLAGGANAELAAEAIAGKAESDKIKTEQERIENEARLGTNQQDATNPNGEGTFFTKDQLKNIKAADQRTQAQQEASTWAKSGKTIEYAKEINKRDSALGQELAVTASGAKYKDKETGALELDSDGKPKVNILVYAKAAKTELEDNQGDENTIVSYAKSTSLPNSDALAILGINMDGTPIEGGAKFADPNPENYVKEERGYIRYAAGRGDKKTSMALVTYIGRLGEEARDVIMRQRNGAPPEKGDAEILDRVKKAQAAYQETGGSAIPPWIGGTDQQGMAEGTYTLSNEEAALVSVAGGKLSGEAFSSMGIDNKLELARILKDASEHPEKLDAALKKAAKNAKDFYGKDEEKELENLERQRNENLNGSITAIDKALNDRLLNKNLEQRDVEQFNSMKKALAAIVAPSSGGTPSPAAPASEPTPPGVTS